MQALGWVRLVLLGTTCTVCFALPAGCNSVLGLGDYAVRHDDAGTRPDASLGVVPHSSTDAAAEALASESAASDADSDAPTDAADCDADPAGSCYPCRPTTRAQLLNACTSAACIPFDDTRLTNLLPDGALPPLPPVLVEAGSD